ncbi:uncharacterized protein LOC135218921 [Macrobrachium nipponense]|uniref:uncharacterized protein LOC135218921 n=1 Tax=Macrobrachium nipponense TaxID=159736 RepID=UPI0030C89904
MNSKKDLETIFNRKCYEEVKKFSSVLYLNSPAAYDIVKEIFMLPNTSVIKSRLQVEDFWPGFTKEALTVLSCHVCRTPREKLCCVMFDFCVVGSRNSVKVAKLLGCSVRPDISNEIITTFPHPHNQEKKIHFIFSVGHTLPLLRNLLADKGTLQSSVYGEIKWKLIKQLTCPSNIVELDSSTGSQNHIKFYNLVKIIKKCGSVFNSTVVAALLLADTLKFKNFANHRNTSNFIADVKRTFDLLNARNPISSEDRPPIHWTTLQEQVESLLNLTDRLLDLELTSGRRVVEDCRWMSVALLAFTLKSVSQLASELLKEKTILYFNTYRISLDHSEMVINHLQRHDCWSDIPTPSIFRKAYKNLFTKTQGSSFYHYDFDGEDFTVGQGDIYLFRNYFRLDHVLIGNCVMHSCSLIDLRAEEEYRANCILEVVVQTAYHVQIVWYIVSDSIHKMQTKKKKKDGRVFMKDRDNSKDSYGLYLLHLKNTYLMSRGWKKEQDLGNVGICES